MSRRKLSPIDAMRLSIARKERALDAKNRGRARKRLDARRAAIALLP